MDGNVLGAKKENTIKRNTKIAPERIAFFVAMPIFRKEPAFVLDSGFPFPENPAVSGIATSTDLP